MSLETKIVDAHDTELNGSQLDSTEGQTELASSESGGLLRRFNEWVKLPPSEVVSVHGRWSNAGETDEGCPF